MLIEHRLSHCTWQEVEQYLKSHTGIILPMGSTEQHGPTGLIGTDSICAETVALTAAKQVNALVAPTLTYTPAQFNMAFSGTVSISAQTYIQILLDVFRAFQKHNWTHIYVVNGHGANIAPTRCAVHDLYNELGDASPRIRLKSWWEFPGVQKLRDEFYGPGEGMHATPSEISITQATTRVIAPADTLDAPPVLSAEFLAGHAGDQHEPAHQHRHQFSDGRVGSDSGLAKPQHGEKLVTAAGDAIAADYAAFIVNE